MIKVCNSIFLFLLILLYSTIGFAHHDDGNGYFPFHKVDYKEFDLLKNKKINQSIFDDIGKSYIDLKRTTIFGFSPTESSFGYYIGNVWWKKRFNGDYKRVGKIYFHNSSNQPSQECDVTMYEGSYNTSNGTIKMKCSNKTKYLTSGKLFKGAGHSILSRFENWDWKSVGIGYGNAYSKYSKDKIFFYFSNDENKILNIKDEFLIHFLSTIDKNRAKQLVKKFNIADDTHNSQNKIVTLEESKEVIKINPESSKELEEEQKRIAEENQKLKELEKKRIAEEKRLRELEEKRKAEEKRIAEEKKKQEENLKLYSVSSGTGFLISDNGYIITNNHVTNFCNMNDIHYNGLAYEAVLIANDPINDLSLLKANIKSSHKFSFAKEDIGLLEDIYIAGFPFGYDLSTSVKVTQGIVSALSGLENNFARFQVDAALQKGNSGGPIIDMKGNVVGVAVEKANYRYILENFDAIPENLNFGIKLSTLESFVKSNGLKIYHSDKDNISKSEIGNLITKATVYVDCLMTKSRFEEVEAKNQKVLFKKIK